MTTKPRIAAFDFDGTITTKDTLLEFIRFAKGNFFFFCGFALYFPLLIAYKLRLYPNWKVKQKMFSFFFKGMQIQHFNQLCNAFCSRNFIRLVRLNAQEAISKHIQQQDTIVIISASIENWVRPFARKLGIDTVLCTTIETDKSGCLTGRFTSANCYGDEKVRRLLQVFPNRGDYFLIAYGDSSGDNALLNLADQSFYKSYGSDE
jgi:HAD superfamily hydrolase (TIGR01490 family)